MFNLGITWDKCESNPVSKVKFYREDPPTERVLSEDEEQRLLECSAEHIKPIIATALNTGLRYGELINLRWQDIDFEGRYIVVRTSKTGNSRKVPMNDTVKETLEQLFLRSTVSDSVSSKVYAGDKSEQSQALRYGNALDSKAVGLTLVRVRVPLCPKIQQNFLCDDVLFLNEKKCF
jgi:integrase